MNSAGLSGALAKHLSLAVSSELRALKAIPKVISTSWGRAAMTNVKNVAKYVGKDVAQQVFMRGVAFAEDKAFEGVTAKIGEALKKKLMKGLRIAFTTGELGNFVDEIVIHRLSKYESDIIRAMESMVERDAHDFFAKVGESAISSLVTNSVVQEKLTGVSLSLASELSQKHSGKKWYYVAIETGIGASTI